MKIPYTRKNLGKNITLISLLVVGLYYLLIPHAVHVRYNLDFGLPHMVHMISGIGLLVLAGFLFRKWGK